MTNYKNKIIRLMLFAWWFSTHTILIVTLNYLIENYTDTWTDCWTCTILMIFGIEFVMFCIITWFAGFACRKQVKKVKDIWATIALAFVIWGMLLVGMPFSLQRIFDAVNFDWTKPIMPPGLFGELVSGMIYETAIAGIIGLIVGIVTLIKKYCTQISQFDPVGSFPTPSAPPGYRDVDYAGIEEPPPYSEI